MMMMMILLLRIKSKQLPMF